MPEKSVQYQKCSVPKMFSTKSVQYQKDTEYKYIAKIFLNYKIVFSC